MRTAVLVSGSREWTDRSTIYERLSRYPQGRGTILIHGDAMGADIIAGMCGGSLSFCVHRHPYYGDKGKAGGEWRNRCMFGALLNQRRFGFDCYVETFPLKPFGGTRNMIKLVRAYNEKTPDPLPLYVYGE